MGMLLHLSLVALGAAYTCALALEIPMSTLVKETLTLLSTHQTVLIGNETLRIPVPAHKNHQLCIEEIFQGIDTLKNQTTQGDAVERLFQNLSLMKKYIDIQKKKCGQERRRVKQFLEYLQEFLGVINTEWMMES
ncbi:interleukin-5 [Ictidomys tridecemlineatus]|uniref:Interleukin-5 n=1 Tax=Ictidomys tridecemlineatus TaxID=43179 RepID=I3MDT8_ICTTR|nr:interleukin-5 [Ictidomys tridecemlineatus]KAG3265523.1 interleukin 5 [Ictidomys tridecemlineatus]